MIKGSLLFAEKMKNVFKKIDPVMMQIICAIGKEADAKGLNVFIVGGFVRDLMLGRKNIDLDVAIEGDAIIFARHIAKKEKLKIVPHHRFGTAVIHNWQGIHVDCVSARCETYIRPGALPTVRQSTVTDDLYRRDFTINALAIGISARHFGKIIDLGHGQSDLKKGLIRVFHEKSFIDDPTRMLRAIRFEQRFNFKLAVKTKKLLMHAVKCRAEKTVTSTRYFQEFARGLSEEFPSRYLIRLKKLCALKFLSLRGFPQKSWLEALDVLMMKWKKKDLAKRVDWKIVYLAMLFSCESPAMVDKSAKFFQWPRHERNKVLNILQSVQEFKLLKRKGLDRFCLNKFFDGRSLETIFFIRAVNSGKILHSWLDEEIKRRFNKKH